MFLYCMYVITTYTSVLRATGSEMFMDINQQNVPPTDSHLVYKIIVCTICMHTVLVTIYIIIFYTSTHTQYRSTHLVEVEHQVELTDVAEELIQYLHKVVDGLKIAEVVVLKVKTEAEVQTSISSVDNLEVTELVEQERRGLSSPYVCTSSLDT